MLLVVDVQTKLVNVMHNGEQLLNNLKRLIQGIDILKIPIIITEQYPQGLGATHEQIAPLVSQYEVIEKNSFSCCQNERFTRVLNQHGRQQVVVCGIETHVCVYQTAVDLQVLGYKVEVVSDAVSSRNPKNTKLALDKLLIQQEIGITGTEMLLYELLKEAVGDNFKLISKILK